MSSHDKTQTKITLNAKKAHWLLDDIKPFVADRPLSKRHVAKLVSEMRAGHFMPEITTIMVADFNGTTYRLNGQHTATAVLEMAKQVEDFALSGVTLITFTVSDETELRKLYARIDRGAARTNIQVTNSILAGTANFAETTARVLKLLPIGLAFMRFENPNERTIYSGEAAAQDVQGDYRDLSKRVSAFMDGLNCSPTHHGHMFRGPVVAALFATFAAIEADDEDDEDDEAALTFWKAVATGVGFESEAEPAARLRQMLVNSTIHGGHLHRGSRAHLGAEDVYRACLHAWNRYREGATFQQALKPTQLKSRPKVK